MSAWSACIATAGVLIVARADAQPAVRVVVAGDCPSVEQVQRSLAAWVDTSRTDAEWTVAVTGGAGSAELAVRDRSGAIALSRRLASRDCGAIADAFAVMIHGRFVELQLLPAPSAVTPTDPSPPTTAIATPAEPPRVAAVTVPVGDAGITRSSPPPPRDRVLAVGVAGGGAIARDQTTVHASLDLAWSPRPRWVLRGAVELHDRVTIGAATDRVEVWQSRAHIAAGRRFRIDPLWVQPMVAAGLVVWRVDPLDLPTTSRWRVQPITEGIVSAGRSFGWLDLRLELRGTVFVVTDRYLVDPGGEIARSPRAALSASAGIAWWFR